MRLPLKHPPLAVIIDGDAEAVSMATAPTLPHGAAGSGAAVVTLSPPAT